MTFKVLHAASVPGALAPNEEIIARAGADLVKGAYWTEDEIIAAARDADAIICAATLQPYPRRVIERLPKCRIIANLGIGYDLLDVQACTEHGICATNVPDYCVEEVSDHATMFILALNRKLFAAAAMMKEGKQPGTPENSRTLMPVFRLRGQTLGIVGLGRIGRALALKAQGFGMNVVSYSPSIPSEIARGLGVELVGNLDELLERSDYVSLHVPARTDNKCMIGADQLKRMKRTAFLINTARGQLVDERALIKALAEGEIAGAGLDVTVEEQLSPDSPLLTMANVIVTGHMAHLSVQAAADLFQGPLDEVARVLTGQWPVALLNPEVKGRFVAKWGRMP